MPLQHGGPEHIAIANNAQWLAATAVVEQTALEEQTAVVLQPRWRFKDTLALRQVPRHECNPSVQTLEARSLELNTQTCHTLQYIVTNQQAWVFNPGVVHHQQPRTEALGSPDRQGELVALLLTIAE